MDDGLGGPYTSQVGLTSPFLLTKFYTQSVVKGRTYRFRYRALNVNGWGFFSPELYVLAASSPIAPPAPLLTFVSSTTVSL